VFVVSTSPHDLSSRPLPYLKVQERSGEVVVFSFPQERSGEVRRGQERWKVIDD
jgi:hypothetical protein